MKGQMKRFFAVVIPGLVLPCGAQAHHAIAGNFDLSTHIVIEDATLTEFRFLNPHVYLYVEAPNADGEMEQWRCEMAAATRLKRRGWTAESLLPGQEISIEGTPAWREARLCHVDVIRLADGTELSEFAGRPSADEVDVILADAAVGEARPRYLPNGQLNLGGPWVVTSESIEMPDIDPTPAGAQAAAGTERHFDSPALTCSPANPLLDWIYEREANDIQQFDDRIVMQYGYLEQERTIWLNMDSHPDNLEPSVFGHAIGRWEGDELIVDTTGFLPGVLDHTTNVEFTMFSAQFRTTERYTVSADGLMLIRRYTFADPAFMHGTYSGEDRSGLSLEPYGGYACEDLGGENNER